MELRKASKESREDWARNQKSTKRADDVCWGCLLFVAHMMLGESKPRLNFKLGTWPQGYR